jgi:NADH-quinone oxidoreductase subunit L
MVLGDLRFEIGFLIDSLTAMMMLVVTFVSLMVHIYTIGYMHDDPGYQRFFSYISLFTFSMLMLVMSNNFLQLFFGWEAVGLVSYLLIGFWYTKETAIYANLKAFLVNRVGDFGFILGIGLVLAHFGSLDYATVFANAPSSRQRDHHTVARCAVELMTVIGILLFIGAMGKSAQFPLHVWLPDSMEGPTPISALIHAATMVTAGIFMVARMSPLYELSDVASELHHGDRRDHRAVHGLPRHRAERHQARGRLFDAVAIGLHDGRARRLGLLGRGVPPDDARLLQGAAVPRRRFGHHRACTTTRTSATWAA